VTAGIEGLPPKPPDEATRAAKQAYSQKVSEAIAGAFAEELRKRGMREARPAPAGVLGPSGAERRMMGGIGPKKVDVSWSTDDAGLLLAVSVKTINFRDKRSGNYQKNLTNRRGDMLFESITLHRRFPYSVLTGFLILDAGAASDATERRRTTFDNAHSRFELFTGRDDPSGRDEQYEQLYIVLFDGNPSAPQFDPYAVGYREAPVSLDEAFDRIVELVATRNADFYEAHEGSLKRAS
jgi:hypothetical protein